MTKKPSENIGAGKLTSGIEPGLLRLQTISFVYGQLANWRDDPERPYEEAEEKLNLQLCKFLGVRANNDFPMVQFNHEEPQAGRRRVDLSASAMETVVIGATTHTIYDPFLVLEGKRLPAPSSGREKEYVTSENAAKIKGGIQRFKRGLHGAKFDRAVMIGYVQKRSMGYWHKTINGWISDLARGKIEDGCAWTIGETLEWLRANDGGGVAECKSLHGRDSGDDIELRHLWVGMAKNVQT